MRSPFATLQELTIPMGAGSTPHIYIGPNLPAPLKAITDANLTAAAIWYFDADEFFFIASGTWISAGNRLVLIGVYDHTTGLTVWQRYSPGGTPPTAAWGSTVFDSNHPVMNFNDIDLTLAGDALLTIGGTLNVIDGATFKVGGGTDVAGAWSTWSPTMTNMTPGNGSVAARYVQIGRTVHYSLVITIGSTSVVGSPPKFTLPVAPNSSYLTFRTEMGRGFLIDVSAAVSRQPIGFWNGSAVEIYWWDATPTHQGVTATAPWTWATGDTIHLQGTYEAA
jgi:hypothetical protein